MIAWANLNTLCTVLVYPTHSSGCLINLFLADHEAVHPYAAAACVLAQPGPEPRPCFEWIYNVRIRQFSFRTPACCAMCTASLDTLWHPQCRPRLCTENPEGVSLVSMHLVSKSKVNIPSSQVIDLHYLLHRKINARTNECNQLWLRKSFSLSLLSPARKPSIRACRSAIQSLPHRLGEIGSGCWFSRMSRGALACCVAACDADHEILTSWTQARRFSAYIRCLYVWYISGIWHGERFNVNRNCYIPSIW